MTDFFQVPLARFERAGHLTPPLIPEWKNPADMSEPTGTGAPRLVAGGIQ